MKNNKEIFKESGITLIALVVTIIVLLILAGISIQVLNPKEGIIAQTKNAKLKSEHARVEEAFYIEAVEYEDLENAGGKTLLDYLFEKGIIDENNIINIYNLLGEKLSTGNGSGISDVYKILEEEETEEIDGSQYVSAKKYKVVYYKEGNSNSIEYIQVGNITNKVDYTTVEEILICENGVITGVKSAYLTEPSAGQCIENTLIDEQFENLVIPSEINGQTVTTIGKMAFAGIRNLKSVTIPNTVTTIQGMALGECISLESVNGLENVVNLEENIFYLCSNLKNVKLNNTIRQNSNRNVWRMYKFRKYRDSVISYYYRK